MGDKLTSIARQQMTATVLSIAGSDPSGGAGIQADLKTLACLGVYGAAAITCLTVQNSRGVRRIEPLPPDLVRDQVQAVLEDHLVTHIKIGMVATPGIARCLAGILGHYQGIVVYDPVLRASTGQRLLSSLDPAVLANSLLPQITVLTPNLPELAWLTGREVEDVSGGIRAAHCLLERFPSLRAVLVKGGHGAEKEKVTDCLVCREETGWVTYRESGERIDTRNLHGTGCTLASAFTAYLCQGSGLEDAFRQSCAYLRELLRISRPARIITNPCGQGPLLHGHLRHGQSLFSSAIR